VVGKKGQSMTQLLISALVLLFSMSSPAMERNVEFWQSSFAAKGVPKVRPNPVTTQPRTPPSFKPDPVNNVTATPRTVDAFLTDAEDFLGKGYTQGKGGSFYSADGMRRVRFTNSDLAGHNGGPSHGHFEFNGGRNIHIPLTDQ